MQRTVKGESMLPFLRALDLCLSERVDPRSIKKGDIVVYEKSGDRVVHRVIDVDFSRDFALVKGDNLPASESEKVPFSAIKEKVVSFKRDGRIASLKGRARGLIAALIAFLSRNDLTPGPLKRRLIDPALIMLARNPAYQYLRKRHYGRISFSLGRRGEKRVLYAFIGRIKSAEAEIGPDEDGAILTRCYVRMRDSNRDFEEIFLCKVRETVSAEFGPGRELEVEFTGKRDEGPLPDEADVDLYPALRPIVHSPDRELEFVIMCSRLEMPDDIKEKAARLVSGARFDWYSVLELAETYRTASFLYGHIQGMKVEVPEGVKSTLRKIAAGAFIRNVRAANETDLLARAFERADIELIFIKGAALLAEIYGSCASRDLSDIDILVREKDFEHASSLLEGEGFRLYEEPGTRVGYKTQRLYEKKRRIPVDLHSGFSGHRIYDEMMGIDRDDVWRNKRELVLSGVRIYALDIEHTLIYTCIHLATHHNFSGLIWYVDLHEFISRHAADIDWGRITALAAKYRVKRPVYYALLFTKRLMGTPVPGEVLASLLAAERSLDKWVFRKIKSRNREVDYLAELFMFDTLGDTAKFVLLNLAKYPALLPHFAGVFSRLVRGSR